MLMPPISFDELFLLYIFEIRPVSFIEQMMVILLFGGSFFGIKIQYMKVLNMGFCKNAFCQGVEWHDHLEVTTGNPRWLLVHILVLRCQTSFFASFVQCIRQYNFHLLSYDGAKILLNQQKTVKQFTVVFEIGLKKVSMVLIFLEHWPNTFWDFWTVIFCIIYWDVIHSNFHCLLFKFKRELKLLVLLHLWNPLF